MVAKKTRSAKIFKRTTRRSRTRNLDVRTEGQAKMFDNMVVEGPMTLVFARLEGCGPCERFKEQVWNPLSKLKNRSMNMVSIESNMIDKSGLNVRPTMYPTLMLVDKNKNANTLPRANTLEEDKAALMDLLTMKPNTAVGPKLVNTVGTPTPVASVTPMTPVASVTPMTPMASVTPMTPNSVVRNSPPRAANYGNSPFKEEAETTPKQNKPEKTSLMNTLMGVGPLTTTKSANKKTTPPNPASDLTPSPQDSLMQTANPESATPTQASIMQTQKGGAMLRAIKEATQSLRSMMNMRPKGRKTRSRSKRR